MPPAQRRPMLSARLTALTGLVPVCRAAADVGADHGYASAELLASERSDIVYVTDVSPKALARAESNLTRLGLAHRAMFILGDGINILTNRDIPPSAVIIAGMGAQTIADILEKSGQTLPALDYPTLALSPNRDPELLRLCLLSHGYCVTHERVVRSAGRWYPILSAKHVGPPHISFNPKSIYLGQTALPPLDNDSRAYWSWRLDVLNAQRPGEDKLPDSPFGSLATRISWVDDALNS